jgi:hypothetical protein
MRGTKSVGAESPSGFSSNIYPLNKCLRILCVLILVLFTLYLIDNLSVSIENASHRRLSNRPFNLDLKISLLFEISHLVSLPFVLYYLVKDIVQGRSDET